MMPFNLFDTPYAIYDEGNARSLGRIYHGTERVFLHGDILVFDVTDAPPRPWLKTFAGLTPYFRPALDPSTLARNYKFKVPRDEKFIIPDMDGRNMENWKPLFGVLRPILRHFVFPSGR